MALNLSHSFTESFYDEYLPASSMDPVQRKIIFNSFPHFALSLCETLRRANETHQVFINLWSLALFSWSERVSNSLSMDVGLLPQWTLWSHGFNLTQMYKAKLKNLAYGRHQLSRPMQIWRGCVIYLNKYIYIYIFF